MTASMDHGHDDNPGFLDSEIDPEGNALLLVP
jgi:hypothetical protein